MTPRLIVSWVLAGVVLATALVLGTTADPEPSTAQEQVYVIASGLRCPQCEGQTLAESDVAIAREIRGEIAAGLERGESPEAITDRLIVSYGDDISGDLPSSGVSGLIRWIPVAIAVLALGGLVVVFSGWLKRSGRHASEVDQQLVAEALEQRRSDTDAKAPS